MESSKFTTNAVEVISGVITICPENGEEVLIRYNEGGYDVVKFYVAGTTVDVGMKPRIVGLDPEDRLLARLSMDGRYVKTLTIQNTGFYKWYPAAGENEADVYVGIDRKHVSHWMRLPE